MKMSHRSVEPLLAVRAAGTRDAEALAPRLRAADLREVAAATGQRPLDVLARGVASSDPALAAVPDGEGSGVVWLLGSDELVRRPAFFLRTSRRWLERLHERYRRLWNFVDARNEVHLRWLRWCGFSVIRTVAEHGIEGRPFHEVESVRVPRGGAHGSRAASRTRGHLPGESEQ